MSPRQLGTAYASEVTSKFSDKARNKIVSRCLFRFLMRAMRGRRASPTSSRPPPTPGRAERRNAAELQLTAENGSTCQFERV